MSKTENKGRTGTGQDKTAGETPLEHVLKATEYSMEGLGATLKLELAFRLEVLAFLILLPLVILIPLSLIFKALVLGSMLMVLIVELLNSALEWVVDYISTDPHPYAKLAKDMGSAAVLLALINAGIFWILAILEWRGF